MSEIEKSLINFVIKAIHNHADIDFPVNECVKRECEENNVPLCVGELACALYLRTEAMSHGFSKVQAMKNFPVVQL